MAAADTVTADSVVADAVVEPSSVSDSAIGDAMVAPSSDDAAANTAGGGARSSARSNADTMKHNTLDAMTTRRMDKLPPFESLPLLSVVRVETNQPKEMKMSRETDGRRKYSTRDGPTHLVTAKSFTP